MVENQWGSRLIAQSTAVTVSVTANSGRNSADSRTFQVVSAWSFVTSCFREFG